VLGVIAIAVGTTVVGFNPNRDDPVILTLPRGGHGIHVTDVIGAVIVTVGIVLLWRSPKA
jgi:hypothetical protein